MLFTLEALDAGKGDALLLHAGSPDSPELIVIDGGPPGIYRRVLKPRLNELRASRAGDDRLTIRMVMVSHIDDDHIEGVLRMLTELDDLRADRKPLPYNVLTLWHNSFDDILGNELDVLLANLQPAASAAAAGVEIPAGFPIHHDAALVLATVRQGRELRARAKRCRSGSTKGSTIWSASRASRARARCRSVRISPSPSSGRRNAGQRSCVRSGSGRSSASVSRNRRPLPMIPSITSPASSRWRASEIERCS